MKQLPDGKLDLDDLATKVRGSRANETALKKAMFVRSVRSVPQSGMVRSLVSERSHADLCQDLVSEEKFRRREIFTKKSSERRDRFCQKIMDIGGILVIFELCEIVKIRVPLFGDFSRSS